MKNLFPRAQFFALCALLCAPAPAAFGQAGPPPPPKPAPPLVWREFTSEAGAFTAKFPAPPRLNRVPFQKGPLNFVRHVHVASVPGLYTFEIDYLDMPAGYSDPDLSTEGGITGMIRSMTEKGGRVLTNTQVRQGTCDGREATLAIPNPSTGGQGFAHGRIFSSGQRYYLLIFAGEINTETARRVGQTFMDSFAVTGGCSKAVAPVAAPQSAPVRSIVAGTPDPSTGWRKIESAGHGFGVLMPGAAELESEQAQAEPIPLSHHTYSHEGENVVYTAEVIGDYPPNFYSGPASYQSMLDVTLFALKRNLEPAGFVLTPNRDLKLGTFPGREYRMASARLKTDGRVQLFITPKRIYIFMAFERDGQPGSKQSIERYFSSIRISAR